MKGYKKGTKPRAKNEQYKTRKQNILPLFETKTYNDRMANTKKKVTSEVGK